MSYRVFLLTFVKQKKNRNPLITSSFFCLQEFVDQFRVLLPRSATACKEDIAALLGKKMGLDPTTYQIGKTKVHQKQSQQPLGPIVASVQHLFILTEIKITLTFYLACIRRFS